MKIINYHNVYDIKQPPYGCGVEVGLGFFPSFREGKNKIKITKIAANINNVLYSTAEAEKSIKLN
jgi:hypothetical protein